VERGTDFLELRPIGYVRTQKPLKFNAPHQPSAELNETNWIELLPGSRFELALDNLASFDRIWLIWWFHRNQGWRPRVLPPRGPAKRRGVFATRSPHRPNPLGLTSVSLLKVDGLVLTVGPLDLVDGSPIFDIKPYLPRVDAFPDASSGWIGEVEAALSTAPTYAVEVSELASRQLAYLRDTWQIDLTGRAFELLRADPTPHRTRRILRLDDHLLRLSCGPWRVYYSISESTITIESIAKGYSDETLGKPFAGDIADRDAQVAFSRLTFSLDTGQ
jgi:tRNA-Thr(GGU) m(6)t(6)A37 methyltransferase TsaA